jgi:hypothetical protein
MRGSGSGDLHQTGQSERQGTGRPIGNLLEPQASQQRIDLLLLGDIPMQKAAGERIVPLPRRCLGQAPRQPAAPVVLDDELQAAVTPDTRMVTTAAASNLLLVGIIIKTFR